MRSDELPKPVTWPQDAQRLGAALAYAAELHGGQARKGTDIPYVSHLLQVAGLVLENGGDVDQAIAGLLHDAIEDCDVTGAEIARRFGLDVARMVLTCTDTLDGDTPDSKTDWPTRKERYLQHLARADKHAILVSACDKRHNLASLVGDVRRCGPSYLDRFTGTPDQQLWFYGKFCDVVSDRIPERLEDELRALVEEFSTLVPPTRHQR
ncbi:MAG: HD domain-containing protein [Candidatus Binatia bacterium]